MATKIYLLAAALLLSAANAFSQITPTWTKLTESLSTVNAGQVVTLTATVGAGAQVATVGAVQFLAARDRSEPCRLETPEPQP